MSKIMMLLELLSDGKWHGIEDLQQRMKLDELQVVKIITFLNEYNFVKMDGANRKVRINRNFRKFLVQTVTHP